MLEDDCEFACPHCGVNLTLRLDMLGGKNQRFVYDCNVCCRPIQIEARLDCGEVVDFFAEAES